MDPSLGAALGVRPGARVALVNEPDDFLTALGPLPDGVTLFERATEPLDVVVYFSDTLANVERRVPLLARYVSDGGVLWMAYPRPSAPVETDVTRAEVDRIGRACGLTPARDVEMDATWTALGLVRAG